MKQTPQQISLSLATLNKTIQLWKNNNLLVRIRNELITFSKRRGEMSKESKHQKNEKKKPAMTLKEKRARKWEKKQQRQEHDVSIDRHHPEQ